MTDAIPLPVSGWDDDLTEAINEFYRALPGWWFRVGRCSVSCDATVAPDIAHVSEPVLSMFDGGFDCDWRNPSTLADALRGATEIAVKALSDAGFASTGERIGQ